MDNDNELDVFINGFEAGIAATRAELMGRPQPHGAVEAAGPAHRPSAPQQTVPAATNDAQAEPEPIYVRARTADLAVPPPAAETQRRPLPLRAGAIAAGCLAACSLALSVVTGLLPLTARPVVIHVTGPPPSPLISVPAAAAVYPQPSVSLPPTTTVPEPPPIVPAGRAWTLSDLPDAGGRELPPHMTEAEHELLKERLKERLRSNGYLPPDSGQAPAEPSQGRGASPRVHFTSGRPS
jgi:hypothetical protein